MRRPLGPGIGPVPYDASSMVLCSGRTCEGVLKGRQLEPAGNQETPRRAAGVRARVHGMGSHAPNAFTLAWIITPDEGMQPQLLVDAAWLRAARHGTRLCM